MKTLKTLFLEELSGRFDGEKQRIQALPKIADAATTAELKELLHARVKHADQHIVELEKIFSILGEKPNTKKCRGTEGILKETDEIAKRYKGSPAINAALISSVQKMAHYKIASYGCLHEWASLLRYEKAVGILQGILYDENSANKSLIDLARTRANPEAMAKGAPADSVCDAQGEVKSIPAAV